MSAARRLTRASPCCLQLMPLLAGGRPPAGLGCFGGWPPGNGAPRSPAGAATGLRGGHRSWLVVCRCGRRLGCLRHGRQSVTSSPTASSTLWHVVRCSFVVLTSRSSWICCRPLRVRGVARIVCPRRALLQIRHGLYFCIGYGSQLCLHAVCSISGQLADHIQHPHTHTRSGEMPPPPSPRALRGVAARCSVGEFCPRVPMDWRPAAWRPSASCSRGSLAAAPLRRAALG